MPTTIYDSSLLTKRARDKAVANSFLTRIRSPNNTSGSAPYLGIYDNSIINTVSVGSRTEYKKCDGGATLVSIGCPCSITKDVNGNIVIPSEVSNIRYIIGSIILKWDAPLVGTGPFTYLVTPYYQGVALQSVTTTELEYRFTNLEESKPYTFTVCAMNSKGQSPVVRTVDPIIMPPSALSKIMSGLPDTSDVTPAIKYIINAGLNEMLRYVTAFNLGPTRSSRIMYLWTMSIVSAWNWVRAGGAVTGLHDGWNWSNKSSTLLSDQESATWLCSVIDYITLKVTPIVNPAIPYKPYVSIYNCPVSTVNTVKNKGNWEIWKANIDGWLQIRASDGSADAATQMPENSANWGKTIVDNKVTDFSTFGDVTKWTRLTVQGKKQGYLTYNWGNVTSTCLDADDYDAIKAAVAPLTGDARADEVTEVLNISKILDDTRKMIAEFWAGGPLTSSPPCIMIWLWKEYMRSLPTITSNKILYSLLDLSIHLFEGGRVTWALKKEYMEARPIQEIRRRYASNPSDL
jgi:hypothetical protein